MTLDEQVDTLWQALPNGLARTRTSKKKIAYQLERALDKAPFDQIHAAVLEMVRSLTTDARKRGETDHGQFIKALDIWLRDERYQSFIPKARSAGAMFQQAPSDWRLKAQGAPLAMLEAMKAQGCPDDVLEQLAGRVGVTNCNANRKMPPTAVYADHKAADVWDRAASGYAERAGYNKAIYSKAYVEHVREKTAKAAGEVVL